MLSMFDFGAAFPSLLHALLFAVLKAAQLPLGAFNVISSMYVLVVAFARAGCDAASEFLFVIMRGVLQGCPLSGSLFVIDLNPLLDMFVGALAGPEGDEPVGIIRVCADDIGAPLRLRSGLALMARVFVLAELVW